MSKVTDRYLDLAPGLAATLTKRDDRPVFCSEDAATLVLAEQVAGATAALNRVAAAQEALYALGKQSMAIAIDAQERMAANIAEMKGDCREQGA